MSVTRFVRGFFSCSCLCGVSQLNFYEFHGYKPQIVLVDVPGYGFAKRSKLIQEEWIDRIATYLQERPARVLRMSLLLVDARYDSTSCLFLCAATEQNLTEAVHE